MANPGDFKPGNKAWMCRVNHGRPRRYDDPEVLWNDACEYFQWVEDNPLTEEKAFAYQGVITKADVTKMRAMTIKGLCIFLGIGETSWNEWRTHEVLGETVKKIDMIIYTQKFEGAAADLLNGALIARELGLADNSKVEHSGSINEMSDEEIDKRINDILAATSKG